MSRVQVPAASLAAIKDPAVRRALGLLSAPAAGPVPGNFEFQNKTPTSPVVSYASVAAPAGVVIAAATIQGVKQGDRLHVEAFVNAFALVASGEHVHSIVLGGSVQTGARPIATIGTFAESSPGYVYVAPADGAYTFQLQGQATPGGTGNVGIGFPNSYASIRVQNMGPAVPITLQKTSGSPEPPKPPPQGGFVVPSSPTSYLQPDRLRVL